MNRGRRLLCILSVLFAAAYGLCPVSAAETPAATAAPHAASHNLLTDARRLAEEGKLLTAKKKYQQFLGGRLSRELKAQIRKELEALNLKILYSRALTPDSFLYEVQPGDILFKIAKENRTTMELIKRANGLKDDTVYAGAKLKLVKTPFTLRVDKSQNKLYLMQGEEVVKTYLVATGNEDSTPVGSFTIETKVVDPSWWHNGEEIPFGDPRNIVGTRWMGFSLKGFGIHGTSIPESIGKNVSAGCVRMLNEDVEELYDLIPLKTEVTIEDPAMKSPQEKKNGD